MAKRLTDKLIREMAIPPKGRQAFARDDLVTGFAARKTATGHTAFVFNYVCKGLERRATIGEYPAWSVSAAREEAKLLRRRVDVGDDPLEEQRAAREELTLLQLWERYEADILPRKAPSSQRNEKSIWIRLILPELGRKKISAISGVDIDRLHRRVSANTPVQANRCLASVQHVFATAIRWKLASLNPVEGVERNRENGRERYLTNPEKDRLLLALDRHRQTASALAIRFLLLTGARSGEVFRATWDQFDLSDGVWVKPSAHTKQRRLHRVPLSAGALETLRCARNLGKTELVFDGGSGKPLVTVKKLFGRVCTEANLKDFRPHDLRHSFASFAVSSGASLPIIGRLLGHTQVSTTSRYTHLEDEPLRTVADRVSRQVLD